eukprot:sb/3469064/
MTHLPYISVSEHSAAQHGYDSVEIMGYWPLFTPSTKNRFLDLRSYEASSDLVECTFNANFNVEQGTQPSKIATPPSKRTGKVAARGRRSADREEVDTTVKSDQIMNMDCGSNTDNCEPFSCNIAKLQVNDTLTITFLSTLYTDQATGSVTMGPYFAVMAVAQSTDTTPLVFGPSEKATANTVLIPVQEEVKDSGYDWVPRTRREKRRCDELESFFRNRPNQEILVPDWLITSQRDLNSEF